MPQAPDDPWVSYGRTVVDIVVRGGASVRIRSAPAADAASWPGPGERPVHLLTAWSLRREAKALGVRYWQDAVYAWTPGEWAVVACLGRRRWASGWSLVVPELGFRFSRACETPI